MKIGPDGPSNRQAWWIAVVLGMASYIDAAAIAGTGTALVLYQGQFELSGDGIGRLSAVLTLGIAVGALIGGRLGDRFGRRRVFTVTMILIAVAALILTLAVSPVMLYLGLGLLGLATGADLPVSLAMIGEAAPEGKRGQKIGLSQGLWVAGIVAAITIGIVFGGSGALGARVIYGHLLVVAIIVLVLRTGIPESAKWRKAEDTRTAGLSLAGGRSDIGALSQLFRSRYVLPLIALGLFFAIANISANTNGQFQTYVYVNVAGTDVQTASMFALISIGVGLISLVGFMRIVDTRFRRIMIWVSAVLAVAAFLIPAVTGVSVATLVTSTVLFSIGGGVLGEPMYKVWSQELFPTLFRGSAQGITIAFTRLVAAGIALITPAIIATGASNLYVFLTATTVIAAVIALVWIPRFRHADTEAGIGGADASASTSITSTEGRT